MRLLFLLIMGLTVSHSLSATTPDDPAYEIQMKHWNSAHAFTLNAVGSEVSGAFDNGGGITFGLETNGSITAAAPAGAPSPVNFSAGGASANLGSVVFDNANGVSFGLAGSTITASVETNYQAPGAYLTTAALSQDSSKYAGTNGAIAGGSITVNTSGVSVNLPAYLTTAMASNRGSDFVQATAAFAGTSASGTIASNGISVSIGPYITTGALSNHSHGNPQLNLTNLSGTTASNSAGFTLSLSAAAPGVGGGGAGTGFTSTTTAGVEVEGTLSTDGLSLAVPAYLTTAQPVGAYLTTARASNDAIGLNTALTANGVAWTVNSSGLSLNVPAFLTTAALSNHSHGNPTLALTNLSGTTASASNGFTLSLAAAAPGGGAGVNRGFMEIMDGERFTTCAILNNATYSNRPIFVPFVMREGGSLAVNTVRLFMSRTGGTVLVATMGVAFYTIANSTSMNLAFSTTHNFSVQSSVSWSGIRAYDFTGMGANSLSAGEYVLGFWHSVAATNSIGLNMIGGDVFALAGYVLTGTNQTAATNSQSHIAPFWGVFNATTAAFPAAVAKSSISGGSPNINSPDIYAIIREI